MPWLSVKQTVPGGTTRNAINTDAIARIGPRGEGSYIHLIDGTSIDVTDSFDEIIEVLRTLAGREK